MTTIRAYPLESILVGVTTLLTMAGFWNIYAGPASEANAYHHLHLATTLVWLLLLGVQLALAGNRNYASHRRTGLAVLVVAPLLVASATLLSVESARKGLASGQGDMMVVQNVMATLELALIIILAFVLRRRRALHASFLMSTALLFLGIATFFTLIGFVPGFRIEGPETFHRFGKALVTVQYTSLAIGALLFAKAPRDGWPFLLVGAFALINGFLTSALTKAGLVQPLTEVVGSAHQTLAFVASFATVLVLLVATGLPAAAVRRTA